MMSKNTKKIIVFVLSFIIWLWVTPNFIDIGLSNGCILANIGLITYLAVATFSFYEFYIGDKFSPGALMHTLKSLEEDDSKSNVFYRRVGASLIVLLSTCILFLMFFIGVC
jgi:hypothetical protein